MDMLTLNNVLNSILKVKDTSICHDFLGKGTITQKGDKINKRLIVSLPQYCTETQQKLVLQKTEVLFLSIEFKNSFYKKNSVFKRDINVEIWWEAGSPGNGYKQPQNYK